MRHDAERICTSPDGGDNAIFESVLRVIVIFVAPSLIVGQRSARGNPGLDKWFLCSLVKKPAALPVSYQRNGDVTDSTGFW